MKLGRIAGSVAALAALAFVAFSFSHSLEHAPHVELSARVIIVALAGIAANLVAAFLASSAWRGLVSAAAPPASTASEGSMSATLTSTRSFVICGRAQIGKYLPGNVFHFVGRAALAHEAGVPVTVSAASISVETLVVAAVAAALGLPVFVARVGELGAATGAGFAVPLAVAGAGAVLVGVVFVFARARIVAVLRAAASIARSRALLVAVVADVVTFAMLGSWLWLVLDTLWPNDAHISIWECISGFALAWVIGFVTPGAPGGIGIREAVFMALLGGPAGVNVAAWLVVVSRLQSVVGDVVTFAVATFLHARRRRAP